MSGKKKTLSESEHVCVHGNIIERVEDHFLFLLELKCDFPKIVPFIKVFIQ